MKNRYKICIVMSQPQTKNSRAPHTKMLSSKTDDITAYKDKTNCSIGSNINERLNTICMWSKNIILKFQRNLDAFTFNIFIMIICRWERLGCFLCVSAKDLNLLHTWILCFSSPPERHPYLSLSLVMLICIFFNDEFGGGGAVELIYLYNIENSI